MIRGGSAAHASLLRSCPRPPARVAQLVPLRCVSKKARNASYDLPTDPHSIKLNSLKPAPGSITHKFIVGRGIGSGKGKTCGKGHKGQWARNSPPDWFEGGQTPLYRRVRKYGFKNPFAKPLASINLDSLQTWFDKGLISSGETITMRTLIERGLLKSIKHGVKLLGRGISKFNAPLKLEVTAVSETAKKAVEKAGGSVTTVYFNALGLRAFLSKDPKDIHIRFAKAPIKKKERFDVPAYSLPLPAQPPAGLSYNQWQALLQRKPQQQPQQQSAGTSAQAAKPS